MKMTGNLPPTWQTKHNTTAESCPLVIYTNQNPDTTTNTQTAYSSWIGFDSKPIQLEYADVF